MLIISLFLLKTYCQDYAQRYAQECCKQYTQLAGEHKGDGVSRIPEERNGLLEDKAPLHIPVDALDKALHRDRRDKSLQRATALGDMSIGNLVEGHKDGGKEGVHHNRDCQRHNELAEGDALHIELRYKVGTAHSGDKSGDTCREYGHRH